VALLALMARRNNSGRRWSIDVQSIYIYMTLLLLLVRLVTETLLLLLVRLVIETLLGLSFATAANEDGGEFAGIDGC
jgi:hypothetical protein